MDGFHRWVTNTYETFDEMNLEEKNQCLKRVEQLHSINQSQSNFCTVIYALGISIYLVQAVAYLLSILVDPDSSNVEPGQEQLLQLEMDYFRKYTQ